MADLDKKLDESGATEHDAEVVSSFADLLRMAAERELLRRALQPFADEWNYKMRCQASFESYRAAAVALGCDVYSTSQDSQIEKLAIAAATKHRSALDALAAHDAGEDTDSQTEKQRCYTHTFVTIDQCGCPPDPAIAMQEHNSSGKALMPDLPQPGPKPGLRGQVTHNDSHNGFEESECPAHIIKRRDCVLCYPKLNPPTNNDSHSGENDG